jgi:hypothetical protein
VRYSLAIPNVTGEQYEKRSKHHSLLAIVVLTGNRADGIIHSKRNHLDNSGSFPKTGAVSGF